MNLQEYFLVVCMEELAEMQQAISKILRFTPEHTFEGYEKSNMENFEHEFHDVLAVMHILTAISTLNMKVNDEKVKYAIENKMGMFKKSVELGAAQQPTETDFKLFNQVG